MSLIPAAGLRFHVQALGSGPPVVLLHGLLVGSLAGWYFTAAPVLARRHRVLLYDLRGHGRSERPPSGYGVAAQATDLEALLGALGVDGPADLVGHSFGGLVALRFALDHAEAVRRLVVVDAPLPPSTLGEIDAVAAHTDPQTLVDALPEVQRAALAGGGRRARRLLAQLSGLVGETTLPQDLAAEADVPDTVLATLRPPLTVVYGRTSACLPAGERLAQVVPGARLVRLDGGHYLPVENPAGLTAALVEALDG